MKLFIHGFLKGAQETPAQFFRPLSVVWGVVVRHSWPTTPSPTITGPTQPK